MHLIRYYSCKKERHIIASEHILMASGLNKSVSKPTGIYYVQRMGTVFRGHKSKLRLLVHSEFLNQPVRRHSWL